MPARLLVDGMNVIGARPDGWWRDRGAAMARLAAALAQLADDVAVVFDGRARDIGSHERLTVHWAPGGRNAADDAIVALVAADPDPPSLTVVTSDADLERRVRALGAQVTGAGAFRARLERSSP